MEDIEGGVKETADVCTQTEQKECNEKYTQTFWITENTSTQTEENRFGDRATETERKEKGGSTQKKDRILKATHIETEKEIKHGEYSQAILQTSEQKGTQSTLKLCLGKKEPRKNMKSLSNVFVPVKKKLPIPETKEFFIYHQIRHFILKKEQKFKPHLKRIVEEKEIETQLKLNLCFGKTELRKNKKGSSNVFMTIKKKLPIPETKEFVVYHQIRHFVLKKKQKFKPYLEKIVEEKEIETQLRPNLCLGKNELRKNKRGSPKVFVPVKKKMPIPETNEFLLYHQIRHYVLKKEQKFKPYLEKIAEEKELENESELINLSSSDQLEGKARKADDIFMELNFSNAQWNQTAEYANENDRNEYEIETELTKLPSCDESDIKDSNVVKTIGEPNFCEVHGKETGESRNENNGIEPEKKNEPNHLRYSSDFSDKASNVKYMIVQDNVWTALEKEAGESGKKMMEMNFGKANKLIFFPSEVELDIKTSNMEQSIVKPVFCKATWKQAEEYSNGDFHFVEDVIKDKKKDKMYS